MRRTQQITIADAGRDHGKVFVLTEMGARPAHNWGCRAIFAVMNAGVDIPDGIEDAGMAGIAAISIKALGKIPFGAAEPLLDELLTCVQFVPDPQKPGTVRALFDGDIEEVKTIFQLQKEAFLLHVQDFTSGAKSTSELAPEVRDQVA